MSVLCGDIDCCPYTGRRIVQEDMYLRIKKDVKWLDCYFDNTPNCEQVTGVTRGNVYKVTAIEGFGDCEDIFFINDNGEEQVLADFFFEGAEDEGYYG